MNRKQAGQLVRAAVKAAKRAYCPYSGFPVGAAILVAGGKVFTGCNVENASYGLTICAERSVGVSAVSAGHRAFRAVAVAAGKGQPAVPCGACLQVLAEFGEPDMPVLLAALDRPAAFEMLRLCDLLPRTFNVKEGLRE